MTTGEPRREPDVSMVVEYVERTGGPMHKTHHWHANVWVGGLQVCDCWAFTRSIALDEADAALSANGVVWDALERDGRLK